MKFKLNHLLTVLIFSAFLFNASPAHARFDWVWDAVMGVWRRVPTPVQVGTYLIAGYRLSEEGYKIYLNCRKGYEQGIAQGDYDHTLVEAACARYAAENQ